MRLYGAYGSNLNLKQMQRRCPGAYPLYSFYLDNYSLVFKGVADLEKQVGGISFMAVYEITKLCEVALDMYEEYPDVYKKKIVKRKIEGKNRDIMFYVMRKKYNYAIPTIKYFNVIKEGYRNWNGSIKLLHDSCFHSINNNSEQGYKSDNWKDKKYINKSLLKKISLKP